MLNVIDNSILSTIFNLIQFFSFGINVIFVIRKDIVLGNKP